MRAELGEFQLLSLRVLGPWAPNHPPTPSSLFSLLDLRTRGSESLSSVSRDRACFRNSKTERTI